MTEANLGTGREGPPYGAGRAGAPRRRNHAPRPGCRFGAPRSITTQPKDPYYAMASHGVHGGPRALYFRLGVPDALETLIAGPSNLGLGDPGIDASLSLGVIDAVLLTHRADLEGLTTAKVIHALVDRAVAAFSEAEAESQRRLAEDGEEVDASE